MTSGGKTAERGYGGDHVKLRRRLLAELAANPGQPCPKCGRGMTVDMLLDLGHNEDRTEHTGLEHRYCNRSEGASRGNRQRTRRRPRVPPFLTSRDW